MATASGLSEAIHRPSDLRGDRSGGMLGRAGPCAPLMRSRKVSATEGFTLVELLVVLALLGLIAAFATPQVMKLLGGAREDAARVQIERLATVLDLYQLETGHYPAQQEGLQALLQAPPGVERWNGPYLRKADALDDPWGNRYVYRIPGQHGAYDLYSLGADGREGGDGANAEIGNW